MLTNLENLALRQGEQIEAFEELVSYVTNHSNPTIEGFVEHWDKHNTAYSKVIVEAWEKVNHPFKWGQE